MVKVMDVRDGGHMVPHHISTANILSKSFDLVDIAIYIRQGATTWKSREHLQSLHGYWLILKFREEDQLGGDDSQ